jgi:hypothetical protein
MNRFGVLAVFLLLLAGTTLHAQAPKRPAALLGAPIPVESAQPDSNAPTDTPAAPAPNQAIFSPAVEQPSSPGRFWVDAEALLWWMRGARSSASAAGTS